MNNKCNFHLYLGKKDFEILSWKASLPPKCFKFYVEQILLSYINGYQIMLPFGNNSCEVELKSTPIHIVIENEQIINFISQIDNGQKSKIIKEIILYYVRESRNTIFVSNGKKNKKQKSPQPSVSIKVSKIKQQRQTISVQKVAEDVKSIEKPKEVISENTNIKEVSRNDDNIIKAPINNEPKQTEKKNNNPMMQALFKMSGDE